MTSVSVNPLPLASAVSGPSSVCPRSTITLTNSVSGGTWSSSNTSVATIGASGTMTGVSGGTTTISYTVTNAFGCSITDTAVETVHGLPSSDTITGSAGVCLGLTTTLSDAAAGGVWSSSDTTVATISSTGVITGINSGSATITYFVTGSYGCTSEVTKAITVNPLPSGTLNPASGSLTLCHGNAATMDVTGTSGTPTFQWYKDGTAVSGATNASYTTDSTGNYTIQLADGGCTVTVTGSVNVLPQPNPVITHGSGNNLYTGTFATYQWYRNGGIIYGATNSVYSVVATGNYIVVVTDVNGCRDTSAVFVVTSAPNQVVNVNAGIDIKLYPNPARSELTIDAPIKVNIVILSTDGKIVIRQNEAKTIDVSNLANGLYMIMIYDQENNQLAADKFIKQD